MAIKIGLPTKEQTLSERLKYGTNYAEFKASGGKIISPSSMLNLQNNAHEWYQNYSGTNPNPFHGNESTVLGSLVHAQIEAFHEGKVINHSEMVTYVDEQAVYIPELVGQGINISNEAILMFNAWKAEAPSKLRAKPMYSEYYMEFDLEPNIRLAGTTDAIYMLPDGTVCITDWKTAKTKKSTIGDYMAQLLSYVIMAEKQGMKVSKVAICYIIRPTKTLPARVFYCEEHVNNDFKLEISTMINNAVRGVKLVQEIGEEHSEVIFRPNFTGMYGGKPRIHQPEKFTFGG